MKKIILTLVVLLVAAPAMAAVTITCAVSGANTVTVSFTAPGGSLGNRVRAFSLDVNVPGDTISNEGNFNAGWWVYPGSIAITGGNVTNYGSPVVSKSGGLMTVEMGSLYASNDPCAAHQSAPTQNGTVLTFDITSQSSVVTITKNAQRGGVVMEDTADSGWSSCTCTAGCGTCPMDITSWDPGVTDGYVGPEDLQYLLAMLIRSECVALGNYCDVTALSAAEACLDVTSWDPGKPDGYVGPEDLQYLLAMLIRSECVALGNYCACPAN